MAVLFSVPKFFIRTPHPLPHGRHDVITSRRILLESHILTTIKGFGLSILPTRAFQNLGLLQGLRKVGDLGTLGIAIKEIKRACRNHAFHRGGAGEMSLYGSDT